MSSWAPTKYKTKNWSSYNDSLKQRGSLSIWFDPEMVWTPPPNGKRGRQQQFSDAAIQTCLTLKVLFCMPLRQTTGFVQSLLRLVGLWTGPRRTSHLMSPPENTECRPVISRLQRSIAPPYRQHRYQGRR
ncbi:transposase [Phaeobacter inhibens DSM 17395]|nr:transposase [Phaeobacter inhibens DSM 17395]AFO91693.1 transposase [Phaeobacter inhibens DSM 17395]